MKTSDRRRIDALVLAAAGLDSGARLAFLADLERADPEAHAAVRSRLEGALKIPEGFLRAPATAILEAATADDDHGQVDVPADDERYELGESLGEGGMARVYRAFDRKLGRTIALKILTAGGSDVLHDPLREARAQARVRHDHVLEVYETGEIAGRAFIALRYAEGGTLASGPVVASASLEQRVLLLAQAAEGLHAAHREGLLHGDVKPSNVLVEQRADGEPRAWIGDFGLATEAGGKGRPLAGTPGFMAPELLGPGHAPSDRRADVYSLGATISQVLGQTLPGPGTRFAALREQSPHLPGELVAVIARCLAAEPADRYPSALEVARDLRRFLAGDVVAAYADRRLYRWASVARRHRALLRVAGAAALLVIVALAVAAAMGVRAVQAKRQVEARRLQAEELIGFMLVDLRDRLDAVGRLDLLDAVGERARLYFASVPEGQLSDRELGHRARALHQIGEVRLRQGDLAGAHGPFTESLRLARRLSELAPGDSTRLFELGQSEFWVGVALWEQGDLTGARGHLEAYYDISNRLVAQDATNREWQAELAYAHSNLGSVLQELGRPEDALARFRSAMELEQQLAAGAIPGPAADTAQAELAASHNAIAVVLEELERPDEAQDHFEADLALRTTLWKRNPNDYRGQAFLATSHQYLGNFLAGRGELEAALPHLQAAHDLFATLTAHDPANREWAYQAGWSHLWLGRLLDLRGERKAALEAWSAAVSIADELVEVDGDRADWLRLRAVAGCHTARGLATTDPSHALQLLGRAIDELLTLTRSGRGAARPERGATRAGRWLDECRALQGRLAPGDGPRESQAPLG